MKKPAIFVVFLVAALAVAAGILWPGQVLALRERRLYGQVAAKAVSADSYDRLPWLSEFPFLETPVGFCPRWTFPQGPSCMMMSMHCVGDLSGNYEISAHTLRRLRC